jgi:alkanesulfonate monooxygenase SsuD/methylene tetrahydromethanopterin reductase-like flavin-dependent oxidoreductase (luciferase family)
MNPHSTLPTLERQLERFHEAREALGRAPARAVPLIRECYVAPDAKTALTEARPFLEGKYAAYRAWEQDKALPTGESFTHEFDTLARDRFIIGDPERVREEIARYQERLGITDLIVRVQWPGMDPARVLRSIRLLGDEVLPFLVA